MNKYITLSISIISEVFAASMLKKTEGFTVLLPSIFVILGYTIAFYCLSLTLRNMALSLAYAIWSGAGTALTAIIGVLIYKESFNIPLLIGLILIIVGVLLLNIEKNSNKEIT